MQFTVFRNGLAISSARGTRSVEVRERVRTKLVVQSVVSRTNKTQRLFASAYQNGGGDKVRNGR